MDEHHSFVNAMIALNLATCGGNPFVNFKLHSFNVKCSQKLVNLGHPFPFHSSDPKVLDACFFILVGCSLVFSSLPTLSFLFFFDAAISYQLQKPKHRIWINIIHLSIQ